VDLTFLTLVSSKHFVFLKQAARIGNHQQRRKTEIPKQQQRGLLPSYSEFMELLFQQQLSLSLGKPPWMKRSDETIE
jgi:hypothetical protein